MSQARTISAEFDLTHADSDLEDVRRPVGSSDSVHTEFMRPSLELGHDVPPILDDFQRFHLTLQLMMTLMTQRVLTHQFKETVRTQRLWQKWRLTSSSPRAPQLRGVFEAMDQVNVVGIFRYRAAVMKTVPRFLHGPFRNVMKVVLEEVMASEDPTRKERGWKAFLLLPRMLLHRPPGGGHISRNKLSSRFEAFNKGEWIGLIEASIVCNAQAAQSRRRQRRRGAHDVEQRAIRAETLIQVGELSHARQVLEGADLAPGNQATLDVLRDQSRRPALSREPLPEELTNFTPTRAFELDESKFNKNLQSSRRGAAAGPSGMTMEHLRSLLDNDRALHSFFCVAEQFARAQVPQGVVDMVRLGRLTALSKPDGGVRGIIAGDVVRRLVARTMSQQLSPVVERATRPHQYAMTTKAGCECIAHALQGLTEIDPETTIISIDGVGLDLSQSNAGRFP